VVPGSSYWIALTNRGSGKTQACSQDKGYQRPTASPEPDVLSEDPEVQEQYGKLGEIYGEFVEDL
jgi:hypothetical protein